MAGIELSAGTIDHQDTGGTGPVVLLLHGLLMDGSLWDAVLPGLAGHRCVVPTLPLGAHRHPVRPGTDLSLPGVARLVNELIDRLDLHDVTLVGNDTGGAIAQLIAADPAASKRVSRLALVSCEAFDNLPPGLTGRTLALTAKLPPAAFRLFMQQMRLRPMRRLPLAFGRLTKRGDATTARWIRPVLDVPGIAADTVRALRATFADRALLTRTAQALPTFDRPALVIWAAGDRVMPPAHGHRLAALLPRGRLAVVQDSYTLIPLDQPSHLTTLLRDFTSGVQ
ncbi:alpha/beta hydrolase [Dactylosporangium sp. NBC_01737]|uniref:alpha/beta fold hydrolase n=1 Tax=Dactylosporangium sp. NBC_01737 TaxID=2975959 RepID=UPI002E0EBEA6|nr:alpha/beta hydrolase [Dactylosporangium sp. NBC_01737]